MQYEYTALDIRTLSALTGETRLTVTKDCLLPPDLYITYSVQPTDTRELTVNNTCEMSTTILRSQQCFSVLY
jgi:hypothetical protein